MYHPNLQIKTVTFCLVYLSKFWDIHHNSKDVWDGYIYLHFPTIHVYTWNPKRPLFLNVNPPEQGLNSNQDQVGKYANPVGSYGW